MITLSSSKLWGKGVVTGHPVQLYASYWYYFPYLLSHCPQKQKNNFRKDPRFSIHRILACRISSSHGFKQILITFDIYCPPCIKTLDQYTNSKIIDYYRLNHCRLYIWWIWIVDLVITATRLVTRPLIDSTRPDVISSSSNMTQSPWDVTVGC